MHSVSLYSGSTHVRAGKIIALEQECIVPLHGQSISKAVPKVEVSRMTATASKGTIGLSRQLRLPRCNRLDFNGGLTQQCIKAAAERGTAIAVNYNSSFQPVCRGKPHRSIHFDGPRKRIRFRFILQNSDYGRGIENHLGSPSSP